MWWHWIVIFCPAEGFDSVGGGFCLKHRFSANCFRKAIFWQVETFRRESIGCVWKIFCLRTTIGQISRRNLFQLWRTRDPNTKSTRRPKIGLMGWKTTCKLIVIAHTEFLTSKIVIYAIFDPRNGHMFPNRALKGWFRSISPKKVGFFGIGLVNEKSIFGTAKPINADGLVAKCCRTCLRLKP